MKKLLMVVLVLLLFSSGIAEEDTALKLWDNLPWNSSLEELMVYLGPSARRIDDSSGIAGTAAAVTAMRVPTFGGVYADITCLYYNDKPCMMECYYTAEDTEDFSAVADAIAKEYENLATYSLETFNDETYHLMDMVNDTHTKVIWTIDAVTTITEIEYTDPDSAYKYCLSVVDKDAMKTLEDVVNSSMTE